MPTPTTTASRLVLAALSGAVCMWLLAGLWHGVIAKQFYSHETGAKHEGTAIIFVAYVLLSLLMVYLYSRVCQRRRPVVEGLVFGAVVGLLWVLPHELAMAGAHGQSLGYVFKNAAWHVVEQGVGGIVIGLLVGKYQMHH